MGKFQQMRHHFAHNNDLEQGSFGKHFNFVCQIVLGGLMLSICSRV